MSLSSKLRQLRKVSTDPRWWPFYLQRRFMQPASRQRLATMVARRLRPAAAVASSVPVTRGGTQPSRLEALQTAGISHMGQLLSTAQAQELTAYFRTKPVHDPYRADSASYLPDSDQRHPESHIAHHVPGDILAAPYLLDIINRPDVIETVTGFLGCKPTLGYVAAWWSYHTALGAQQAEHFHRDVDDWRFVKLFIYLTDVGKDNGPHIYVSHSSISPALRQIRRYDDAEVVAAFGQQSVMELTGRAGEGFLEDTFGMHKGQPVAQGQRLLFQAVYSMFPLPYGPKAPVARLADVAGSAKSSIDPWINRLYLKAD